MGEIQKGFLLDNKIRWSGIRGIFGCESTNYLLRLGHIELFCPCDNMFVAVAFTMVVSLAWYRYFNKLHQKVGFILLYTRFYKLTNIRARKKSFFGSGCYFTRSFTRKWLNNNKIYRFFNKTTWLFFILDLSVVTSPRYCCYDVKH